MEGFRESGSCSDTEARTLHESVGPRAAEWVYWILPVAIALIALVVLLAPITIMILLSVNRVAGHFDYTWTAFSLHAWAHPFAIPNLIGSFGLSVVLAAIVAPTATALGTLLGYAEVKFDFYGKRALDIVLLLTIATPEVIMGSSLLDFYLAIRIPTGFMTLLLSHVMFDIAFTTIVVKSRLRTFDFALEQAGMDLGASGLATFLRVTLPLIAPAIVTAALLAFMLSMDDFIVSNFVSGATVTFPLFIWGTSRVAMPPQVYVVGTATFLVMVIALGLVAVGTITSRRRGVSAT